MSERKTRWLKRLAKAGAVAAAAIVVLAVAGKWWLAPALLRWHVRRVLPEYWDGPVEIADVDFNYTGAVPVTLHGLALRDRRGRCWLHAKSVWFVLSDWPSLHPRLGALIVTRPTVTAHRVGGRYEVPLKRLPVEWWDEYVDLKGLSIERGSLELTEDGEWTVRTAGQDLALLRALRGYRLSVAGRRLVVRDLRAEAFLVKDDGVEIRGLGGRTCGGRLEASVTGRLTPGGGIAARGDITARAVDLAQAELPIRGAEKGLLTGMLRFQADGSDGSGVSGHGTAFVEGADLREVPVVGEVLRRAGLGKPDVLSDSDVEVQFALRGAEVVLQRTRIQLRLAAVDVEPGGTVDLRSGQIDVVAVVVLFQKVRDLLRTIPLVSMVVDLTERLSRLHVEGTWDRPESLVITPAPLREIREGSKEFLTAAARGGRQVGKAVLGGLNDLRALFGPSDPNAPTTKPAKRE